MGSRRIAGSNLVPQPTRIIAGVYVAQNLDERFYIGMTTDLEARIRDHHCGRRTTFQRFWVRY
jgi:predicted GIY-YIG superfamily endonuclease